MKPFIPEVRLIKKFETTDYFAHIVVWTDHVKFVVDSFAFAAATKTVTIKIKENAAALNIPFLTPFSVNLPLAGIVFSAGDGAILNVEVFSLTANKIVGKRKTHVDDAEDTVMPR